MIDECIVERDITSFIFVQLCIKLSKLFNYHATDITYMTKIKVSQVL